ncbi:MAG: hypothetical protein Q7S56_00935 [Nanoarchaeota archaeon]|nr:hypothetical protein [Nanoarchaeota archaeon]
MTFLSIILEILHANPFLSSFFAGFISEETLVLAAFMSGNQNLFPFWMVFVFGILGLYVFDLLWFIFSKSHIIKMKFIKQLPKKNKSFTKIVHSIAGENIFLTLLLSKFIYGARQISMTYASSSISLKKFLLYDVVSLILWGAVMLSLGWFAGRGILISMNTLKGLEKGLAYGFFFILFLFIINKIISSYLSKKVK